MSQTQVGGAGADLAALRAQYGAHTGNSSKALVVIPEQPAAPPCGESYGGRIKKFVQDNPRLTTAAMAVGVASVATRTNPVRWLKDHISTAAHTVAGAMAGGIGSWVALTAGHEALVQVAHAVSLGTGTVETAAAVGLVALGGWAGRAYSHHRIAVRDEAAAAKARATGREPKAGMPGSLPRAALLVAAGAALPHIIAKVRERSQS